MNYTFKISQLEILSILTFDASVNYCDITRTPIHDQIEFEIERRTFENVKRSKFLFWNRTEYQGMKSKLKISGINSISVEGTNERFMDNHFIDKFEINETFKVILTDFQNSEFGSGSSIGKHGFTKTEWKDYLLKMNYTT